MSHVSMSHWRFLSRTRPPACLLYRVSLLPPSVLLAKIGCYFPLCDKNLSNYLVIPKKSITFAPEIKKGGYYDCFTTERRIVS